MRILLTRAEHNCSDARLHAAEYNRRTCCVRRSAHITSFFTVLSSFSLYSFSLSSDADVSSLLLRKTVMMRVGESLLENAAGADARAITSSSLPCCSRLEAARLHAQQFVSATAAAETRSASLIDAAVAALPSVSALVSPQVSPRPWTWD